MALIHWCILAQWLKNTDLERTAAQLRHSSTRSCCCCSSNICLSTCCMTHSRAPPTLSSSYRYRQSCHRLQTWWCARAASRRGSVHEALAAPRGQRRPRLSRETRVPEGWFWTRPVAEKLPPSDDEAGPRSACARRAKRGGGLARRAGRKKKSEKSETERD